MFTCKQTIKYLVINDMAKTGKYNTQKEKKKIYNPL